MIEAGTVESVEAGHIRGTLPRDLPGSDGKCRDVASTNRGEEGRYTDPAYRPTAAEPAGPWPMRLASPRHAICPH